VVELSGEPLPQGIIVPIKVISVLGMVDEGESDWKIIGIRADHPKLHEIDSMEDANRVLGFDWSACILDWFQNYKVPDGKPQNSFTHNNKFHDPEMAVEVIEEGHRYWYELMLGNKDKKGLSLTSVTQKHLLAQGVTSTKTPPELPKIAYPRYHDWQPRPVSRLIVDPDSGRDQYALGEEAPDEVPRKRC